MHDISWFAFNTHKQIITPMKLSVIKIPITSFKKNANSSKTREFAFHQMKNLGNTTRTKGSTLYTVKQCTITAFRVSKTKELSFQDETTNQNLQSQSRVLPSHVGRRHFKALLDLLLTTIKILSRILYLLYTFRN